MLTVRLACVYLEENVRLNGNYGFKDAWCAVNWVRENIAAFGGDEGDVTLTGLSAGERCRCFVD
jgi:carboxylesterase type B